MKKMLLPAGVMLIGLVVGCGAEKKPTQAPPTKATMDAMKDKATTPTPPAGTTDDKKP